MGGCVALVVAGGRGTRFGGDLPKQYRLLAGKAVIRHALEAFAAHPQVDAVQAVIHPDDATLFAEAAAGLDLPPPVHGGATRQESVRLGLESLAASDPALVLIHDAARPHPGEALIGRVIAALAVHPGAIPALPVADTLKRGADGRVADTLDRAGLWRAQTPQGFRYAEIMDLHRRFQGAELTDDAALFEQAGLTVALVQGSEENQKVTTQEDLLRADRAARPEVRTGTGFDVHRIVRPADGVFLCGVKIPADFGLKGHSDADVALHALTDAILGAIGAGDIGTHFPPSDPRWKGAPSDIFLKKAGDLVAERGGRIVNLDLTIVCEVPKVGPHRAAMEARIAAILGIEPTRVNVKGKTTEELGFTGRGEGIAAQAAASVEIPGSQA
ncbi:MAG: bifunctional 2-C-methyl-D-erythritol 4-phosphate cytidylyltransferase/2-C-methyl-D-erythritol 2,4-cyclodiphosphate synthase [Magnetospirillum sp. WYHS-4]